MEKWSTSSGGSLPHTFAATRRVVSRAVVLGLMRTCTTSRFMTLTAMYMVARIRRDFSITRSCTFTDPFLSFSFSSTSSFRLSSSFPSHSSSHSSSGCSWSFSIASSFASAWSASLSELLSSATLPSSSATTISAISTGRASSASSSDSDRSANTSYCARFSPDFAWLVPAIRPYSSASSASSSRSGLLRVSMKLFRFFFFFLLGSLLALSFEPLSLSLLLLLLLELLFFDDLLRFSFGFFSSSSVYSPDFFLETFRSLGLLGRTFAWSSST
mmetsp:Transcript_27741/g.77567  ORF Transcript_27741/g.77567 Transcript_27741/m.77567 type:complete len:272 (-) Transcript_27741:2366-3181(-)